MTENKNKKIENETENENAKTAGVEKAGVDRHVAAS